MDKPMPPDADARLSGLWMFDGQQEKCDDPLAKARMGLEDHEDPPLHGNYTRFCYHRVVTRSGPDPELPGVDPLPGEDPVAEEDPLPSAHSIANWFLDIFDEEGNFGHFEWNDAIRWGNNDDERGAWQFSRIPFTMNLPQGKNSYLPKGQPLYLPSSLTLTPFSEKDRARFPPNGADDKTPCPLPWPERDLSPPNQYIYYDADSYDADRVGKLVWVREAPQTLLRFTQQHPQPRRNARDCGLEPWNGLFVVPLVQFSFPFVGWSPAELDDPIYNKKEPFASSGTHGSRTDGQPVLGRQIFVLPELGSADYVTENTSETHKVFLALGTRFEYLPSEVEATHSQMLSTTSELVNSWTSTLGLSAGIEKVMAVKAKGTYHEKITQQQEHESRYSLSRRVATDYVVFTDIKNLQLEQDYRNAILRNLRALSLGGPPDWRNFVQNYGTHYVHALTYGRTDFAEINYSMDAELYAREQTLKLEQTASDTLQGIKFGSEAGSAYDWGQKVGNKVTSDHVVHRFRGFPGKPAAIFLDLRPAWELFSPVFFPPNFTEYALPEEVIAPFVWRELRRSFRGYVEKTFGVNQSLDASYFVDHTPRFFKVTVPEFKIWTPNGRPAIWGTIKLTAWNGAQRFGGQNWEVNQSLAREISNGSDLPGLNGLTCTLGAGRKVLEAGGGYAIEFDLYNSYIAHPQPENIRNKCTYPLPKEDQEFEWHEGGFGYKIVIKLQEMR